MYWCGDGDGDLVIILCGGCLSDRAQGVESARHSPFSVEYVWGGGSKE